MTIERVRQVRPDLTATQAAEVIMLIVNDGATIEEESIKVFADWLFADNSKKLLRKQQKAIGKCTSQFVKVVTDDHKTL